MASIEYLGRSHEGKNMLAIKVSWKPLNKLNHQQDRVRQENGSSNDSFSTSKFSYAAIFREAPDWSDVVARAGGNQKI